MRLSFVSIDESFRTTAKLTFAASEKKAGSASSGISTFQIASVGGIAGGWAGAEAGAAIGAGSTFGLAE